MRTVLCVLFITWSIEAFSQVTDLNKRRQLENFEKMYRQDTMFRNKLLNERYQRDKANGVFRLPKSLPHQSKPMQRDTQPGMPVVKLKLKGEFKGNNGKGSDIYAMTPDSMPCLVPDSTYASRMPVKSSTIIMRPKINRATPEQK